MLQYDLQLQGIVAINQAIAYLSSKHPNGQTDGEFKVTAFVRGKEVVSGQLVHCDFAMHYDDGEIHIFWETSGLASYLKEGLYGAFTTKWQIIELVEPEVIEIIDRQADIKITINYGQH